MATKQHILGRAGNIGGAGITRYVAPTSGGRNGWFINPQDDVWLIATAGTIKNLSVHLLAAPGVGQSYTFTVYNNGSPTAITFAISGTATSGSDTSNEVTVAEDDEISIECVTSGSAVNTTPIWEIQYVSSEGNGIAIYSGEGSLTTTTAFAPIFNSPIWGTNFTTTRRNAIVSNGDVTKLKIKLSVAPGSGNSRTFVFIKDTVVQDGSGGTPDTRVIVSDANTTGSWTGTLEANDDNEIQVRAEASGAANSDCSYAIEFISDVDGEFNSGGFAADNTMASGEMGAGSANTLLYSSTESSVYVYIGTDGLLVSKLRIVGTAGAFTNLTFTVRKNGSSTAITCNATGTSVAQDFSNSDTFADGDFISLIFSGSVGLNRSMFYGLMGFDQEVDASAPFVTTTEWPNPELEGKQNLGFANNNTLFQPIPEAVQNSLKSWPNPLIGKRLHVGWTDYYTFEDLNFKPVGVGEFPSRIERKKSGPGWIQNRPFYYQDDKPFKQDAWPNPELRLKPRQFHIYNRKLDEPPTPEPFKVPNYPNPLLKKRINPSYTDNFSLEETFTRPIASSTFDNPVLKVKPLALTWIQPRAFFYEEPSVIVFRQNSWPNPSVRKGLQGIINRHFIDSGITVTPFNQNNWPLPLRKRIHPKWEDNYVLDDNVPFTQLSFILPLRKSNFTPTWINPSILITQAGTPIVPYDYPNPIIVKQHTLTWIDNLLQNNLDPGEGEKPFNQNDYPNPLIGLKLLHTGWIDIRKFYFDEPPLQIAQYDWPVFRPVNRNQVGHIHSQKQDEEPPKFVSVDNLPLVKNVLGITWIDNPLIVITGPVLIKPFNQNDYPNPRLRIPYYNNFNIFRPTSLIPPFIRGRKICLDAGFTIFELEAALEEYEIKARAEDFILNADGEECE